VFVVCSIIDNYGVISCVLLQTNAVLYCAIIDKYDVISRPILDKYGVCRVFYYRQIRCLSCVLL
jgi:hypothetical protein